jgi:predicted AAA+ superfamily ATPase
MYPRYLKDNILRALKVSPIMLLIGPRRSGKTTLMQAIGQELKMQHMTFDTLKQLAAAQEDPEGFIQAISTPVIIDEVQRVPPIALPIKLKVDQEKKMGFFGLTGSANPLVAPKLNDSLAGRMFIIHMWPLSITEILQKPSHFLKLLFDPNATFPSAPAWSRQDMIKTFQAGGYPDVLTLDDSMRDQWFDNLLTTILERDIQDITNITRCKDIAKLLNILASRNSNLLNLAEISRIASIPYTTLNNYMVILEFLFLITRQPAWHINKTKRLIKMPKLYFGDTGLLINQLKLDVNTILNNGRLLGSILENFVFLELKKQASWSLNPIDLYHYRTQTGSEVDIVLENRQGQIVGIEIKASETISPQDCKGLDVLEEEMKEKFVRGIILYAGTEIVMFKQNRLALPLSLLWNS